jgi:eukaryotic-like serine/threonine-protein kinase
MSVRDVDPRLWPELSGLLDTALDLPAGERGAWLEMLGPEHAGLKPALRELLARAASIETGDFLAALPALPPMPADEPEGAGSGDHVGDTIGRYRLLRSLGSGGMASVWLAERLDRMVNRPIALKLPHGEWRFAGLAERFAREREILATFEHPHIARLYDAGVTAEGRPFLALEFVDGVRIDEYCRVRALDLKGRLGLFEQAARAVIYAHGKLTLHRDLKPANILVTDEGQVKLLDFGIAKLLADGEAKGTQLTELSGRALTPDYASPEQILGLPLTIASDVYSLGVLLYELLTGARPYKLKRDSIGALEDAILQVDPARPSDVARDPPARRALRGDLDTIVLKALKKNAEERYATVNALVDDLSRYLDNRPVLARPDSWRYRSARFARRNKVAVGAAAAVAVALLTGAAAAAWQASVARFEQRRAEGVTEFLASTLRDADPYRSRGETLGVAELLRQAQARVAGFGAQPEVRVEILRLLGSSLLNLEDLDSAERAAQQALAEALASLGPEHEQTLRARILMLGVHRFRGRTAAMRSELETVEAGLRSGRTIDAADRITLLESRVHLSIDDGDSALAVSASGEAFELALAAFGERDTRTVAAATLRAEAYEYSDVTAEFALQAAERAFGLAVALYGSDSSHPRMINVRDVYGRALGRAGRLEEGVAQLERATQDAAAVFGATSLSISYIAANLARYQRQLGAIKPALTNLDRAIAINAQHVERDSFTYLSPLTARGIALLSARRAGEALRDLNESSEGLRKVLGPDNEETAIADFNRGLALAYLGRAAEARAAFEPVLGLYRSIYSDSLYLPSRPLSAAGTALRLAGDFGAALARQEEALATIAADANAERLRMPVLLEIGLNQLGLGEPQRALASLEEARRLEAGFTPAVTPLRADILVGLGRARLALGDATAALEVLQQADDFWLEFDARNRWAGEAAYWLGASQRALGHSGEANAAFARAAKILVTSPIAADATLVAAATAQSREGSVR